MVVILSSNDSIVLENPFEINFLDGTSNRLRTSFLILFWTSLLILTGLVLVDETLLLRLEQSKSFNDLSLLLVLVTIVASGSVLSDASWSWETFCLGILIVFYFLPFFLSLVSLVHTLTFLFSHCLLVKVLAAWLTADFNKVEATAKLQRVLKFGEEVKLCHRIKISFSFVECMWSLSKKLHNFLSLSCKIAMQIIEGL